MFEKIKKIHCVDRGHVGRNKTNYQLSIRYSCIPKDIIHFFIDNCDICLLKIKKNYSAALIPIRSSQFLNRFQIDLIDMSHDPDGEFNWIAHIIDHFSKLHMANFFSIRTQNTKI